MKNRIDFSQILRNDRRRVFERAWYTIVCVKDEHFPNTINNGQFMKSIENSKVQSMFFQRDEVETIENQRIHGSLSFNGNSKRQL